MVREILLPIPLRSDFWIRCIYNVEANIRKMTDGTIATFLNDDGLIAALHFIAIMSRSQYTHIDYCHH